MTSSTIARSTTIVLFLLDAPLSSLRAGEQSAAISNTVAVTYLSSSTAKSSGSRTVDSESVLELLGWGIMVM